MLLEIIEALLVKTGVHRQLKQMKSSQMLLTAAIPKDLV